MYMKEQKTDCIDEIRRCWPRSGDRGRSKVRFARALLFSLSLRYTHMLHRLQARAKGLEYQKKESLSKLEVYIFYQLRR